MKKTAIIAAAAVVASTGAAFGQTDGTIELRIVTARTFDAMGAELTASSTDPINVDPMATDFSQDFYVQARVMGDADATGLVTFDGNITDDGNGTVSIATLTNTEALGFNVPGNDFMNRAGMFPSYRATIGGEAGNSDAGNGAAEPMTGNWLFLPLNIEPAGNGQGIGGAWSDVYKFNYATSDVSARTLTLDVFAEFGGYQSSNGLQQPAPIAAGSFDILFVPAPGAAALLGAGGLLAMRRRR